MESIPAGRSNFQPRGENSPNTHYVSTCRRRAVERLAVEQAHEDRQGLGHQRINARHGGGNGLTAMEREVYWARYSKAWQSASSKGGDYHAWINR